MYKFPLEESESIVKKGMASLHDGIDAYSGALYLTTERVVFVGYLMDITRKYMVDVSLAHICDIKGDRTFYIIPNVLKIATIRDKQLNFVVSERNDWIAAISRQIDLLK